CVLAVRAICGASGTRAVDEEILALALAAHWAEQGGSGSGGDVAAATLGGVLEGRSRIPWRAAEEAMTGPGEQIAASGLFWSEGWEPLRGSGCCSLTPARPRIPATSSAKCAGTHPRSLRGGPPAPPRSPGPRRSFAMRSSSRMSGPPSPRYAG